MTEKYTLPRGELLSRHVTDFIRIHEPYFQKGFIPTRWVRRSRWPFVVPPHRCRPRLTCRPAFRPPRSDDVGYMLDNTMNSGSLMPHFGLYVRAAAENHSCRVPLKMSSHLVILDTPAGSCRR